MTNRLQEITIELNWVAIVFKARAEIKSQQQINRYERGNN